MSGKTIRILLVDDHYVVRMGLRGILASDPQIEVVAEAASAQAALECFRQNRPDVTLMDVRMPGTSGIEGTAMLRAEFPTARVIILTTSDGEEDIHRALLAGAQGYLFKDMPGAEILRAIREVHAGGRHLPKPVAARLAEREPLTELSPKQLEVLQLMVKGLGNQEIAGILGVSENTVKTHVKAVMFKLDVNTRTEAARVSIERGIVHLH